MVQTGKKWLSSSNKESWKWGMTSCEDREDVYIIDDFGESAVRYSQCKVFMKMKGGEEFEPKEGNKKAFETAYEGVTCTKEEYDAF